MEMQKIENFINEVSSHYIKVEIMRIVLLII